MADTSNWDPTGEAARQLEAAVDDYGGEGCLSDPEWLTAWFADVLPDAPRERDLLITAAEFGVVRRLSAHIETNVDPETAVRLTASDLGAERAFPPDACYWAVAQFARALGHTTAGVAPVAPPTASPAPDPPEGQTPGQAPPPPGLDLQPPPPPQPVQGGYGAAPTVSTYYPGAQPPAGSPRASNAPGGYSPPASSAPGGYSPPAGNAPPASSAPGEYSPPASSPSPGAYSPPGSPPPEGNAPPASYPSASGYTPAAGYAPGYVPPGGYAPPAGYAPPGYSPPPGYGAPPPAAPPPAPRKRRRTPLLIGAVVAVVVLYLIVASVAKLPPLSSSTTTLAAANHSHHKAKVPTSTVPPVTAAPPTTIPTTTAPPATTTPTTVNDGNGLPLATLMPDQGGSGIDVSNCGTARSNPFTGVTGEVSKLECKVPGESTWQLNGWKFDNPTDYRTSLAGWNKAYFTATEVGNRCPPPGDDADGLNTWHSTIYASTTGQILECSTYAFHSQDYILYLWTLPTQDAFFEIVADPGSTTDEVNDWWGTFGSPRI